MDREVIFLFDLDGTLTLPRQLMDQETREMLKNLSINRITTALVSGSDINKITEQIGDNPSKYFNYVFSENGLLSFHNGNEICRENIVSYLGESNYGILVNTILEVFSKITLPKKRGLFIELRNGMINICPIGRSCTKAERAEFEEFDKQNGIRTYIINQLQNVLATYNLEYAIGGQISIDIYPKGWDKTYCLKHIADSSLIYFFGDKTEPGGNDHTIAMSKRVCGHTVMSPKDTIEICNKLLCDMRVSNRWNDDIIAALGLAGNIKY